jgi:flagellar hook-associated protein 2
MSSISGTTGATTTNTNYYLLNTGNNNLQISGLASGIDVDSIVNKLMQAESVPLDTMNQQLQLLEWKRDDYRSMSDLLSDLQSIVSTMTLQSSYGEKATVSDESKVTAAASSGAEEGTYTLSDATLATVATNQSGDSADDSIVKSGSEFDPNKALIEQANNLTDGIAWDTHTVDAETHTVSADGTVFSLSNGAVTANSITVTAKDGTKTNYELVASKDDLATSDSSKHQVYVDATTGQLTFNQTISKDSTIEASYEYKTVDIDLTTYDSDGKAINTQFDANGSLSLNTILQKINASDAGVNAFYDTSTGKVSISTSNTGKNNETGPQMTFSGFLKDTLLLDSANEQGGTDATFTINGVKTTRHSNTFTVNNTTFTLTSAIPSTETVTVELGTDTDGMFDTIKSFVDKYNDTIKQINDMITVAPDRDYPPLTSAQKAQMNQTDIDNWNEKARQGTLYGDTILGNGLSDMREDLYNAVDGTTGGSFTQLAQIGITTSSDYQDHGKLIIDESKLKEAISSDPDGVMKLFTSGNTASTDTSTQGIAKRLYNTLNNTIAKIKEQAGTTTYVNDQFSIGRSIDDLNEQISTFQDHLKTVQTRYYTEFTAMEEAIEQANSQATYLQNAFS